MEIRKKYLGKYLHDIAIEQIAEDYVARGYSVTKEEKLGNFQADLIARKGNDHIVIEVIAGKKLEIDNIEMLITNYVHTNLPSDLDELSTHTRPVEVYDVNIYEIKISGKKIFVKGEGGICVEFQYGSDVDHDKGDCFKFYDVFPFDFEITLSYNSRKGLEITEVDKLNIDTSFYHW